ncbi:MAG: thioesterase family protein [Acidimicrobiales bacterium]
MRHAHARAEIASAASPTSTAPTRSANPGVQAWVRYDDARPGDDLAKALLAHFTGHLSISTTMRAHMRHRYRRRHKTVSTAPIVISVAFHEPVTAEGWLLYDHESTFVGARMSYVRSQIFTAAGRLGGVLAQEAMIRPLGDGKPPRRGRTAHRHRRLVARPPHVERTMSWSELDRRGGSASTSTRVGSKLSRPRISRLSGSGSS